MPLRIQGAWQGRGHCPLPYGPILSRRSVGTCPKCHTSRAWQGRDYHPLPYLPDRSTCCRGWGFFAPVVPYGGAARGAFRTCCDRHCARTGTTPDITKQTETRQTENNNKQTEKRRQRQSFAFPVPDRGQLLLSYGRAPCKQKSYLANFSLVYLSWEACERG